MKKLLFLSFFAAGILYSCHSSKKAGGETATGADSTVVKQPVYITDTIYGRSFHKPIRNKDLYSATQDLIFFDTAYVSKDTLHLLTKKLAGCEAEKFQLVWNGIMLKSMPPQTSLKLLQTADATCKQRNYFHLTYNLKPVRFKDDSTATGTTLVRVIGWKGILRYEF